MKSRAHRMTEEEQTTIRRWHDGGVRSRLLACLVLMLTLALAGCGARQQHADDDDFGTRVTAQARRCRGGCARYGDVPGQRQCVAGASYQWQISTDGGTTFTDIGGATAASYRNGGDRAWRCGDKFRAIVTNSAGSVTSDPRC